MSTLYVLELDDEKIYVGKTNKNVEKRILEHFQNNGSEWTKLFKPKCVLETIDNIDQYDEDKYTKKYMSVYGIDNVRGGSYVQVKLPKYQIQALETELCSSQNKCFNCSQIGHFTKNCPEKNESTTQLWMCSYCNVKFTNKSKCEEHVEKCTAFDVNNKKTQSSTNRFKLNNKFKHTTKKYYVDDYDDSDSDIDDDDDDDDDIDNSDSNCNKKCFKCGRYGHFANKCYAKTHKKGYYLKN